jgi:hypothetical protein
MGGEGTHHVFGQNEAYDPIADRWESLAPMITPRHGLGAAVLGDAIHVAGGGPIMGGGVLRGARGIHAGLMTSGIKAVRLFSGARFRRFPLQEVEVHALIGLGDRLQKKPPITPFGTGPGNHACGQPLRHFRVADQ